MVPWGTGAAVCAMGIGAHSSFCWINASVYVWRAFIHVCTAPIEAGPPLIDGHLDILELSIEKVKGIFGENHIQKLRKNLDRCVTTVAHLQWFSIQNRHKRGRLRSSFSFIEMNLNWNCFIYRFEIGTLVHHAHAYGRLAQNFKILLQDVRVFWKL